MDAAAVDVVRRFYEAVARRDPAKAESCFAPDALWHLPGHGPIAGDHVGWPAIRDGSLAKRGPLSGGTFKAELLDVAWDRVTSWLSSTPQETLRGACWTSPAAS